MFIDNYFYCIIWNGKLYTLYIYIIIFRYILYFFKPCTFVFIGAVFVSMSRYNFYMWLWTTGHCRFNDCCLGMYSAYVASFGYFLRAIVTEKPGYNGTPDITAPLIPKQFRYKRVILYHSQTASITLFSGFLCDRAALNKTIITNDVKKRRFEFLHCKKYLCFKTKFTGNCDPGVETGSNWNVRLIWLNGVTILNWKRNSLSEMETVRYVYAKNYHHRFIPNISICWKKTENAVWKRWVYFSGKNILTVSLRHFRFFSKSSRSEWNGDNIFLA